jgi:flagellin
MPINSINTNIGAMIALQALNGINGELATVRARIATGLKVAGPKDNPAVWAIAQNMRAESKSLDSVKNSLQRGQAVVEVALNAGEAISDILMQMKEKVLAATEAGLTSASRQALSDEYVALRAQIDRIAGSATFDGVNLVAAGGGGGVKALADARGGMTIDVAHVDLSTGGAAVSGTRTSLTGAVGSADIAAIDAAIQAVSGALSKLGVGGKSLDRHLGFVGKLQDTIDSGVGNLVDADLGKESARLIALQTKQQLAIEALRIANQAPSLLLALFRRS